VESGRETRGRGLATWRRDSWASSNRQSAERGEEKNN
jgi:hypothetical protein